MHVESPVPDVEAPRDCPRCPRLVDLRTNLRKAHPDWWNAPVPAFGDPDAWLAIVGLAPGKKGANRTGRPFTGDKAGELLFGTLGKVGLTEGRYDARPDDGVTLRGCVILNAVKCVPPGNDPTTDELKACQPFYVVSLASLPMVRTIVALGEKAHRTVLKAAGVSLVSRPFGHLAEHVLPDGRLLLDSYHCSGLNQNTGRLTPAMFEAVFARALELRS